MNLKEIKELINLMNENDLTEIEIERENAKVRLSKKALQEKLNIETPSSASSPSSVPSAEKAAQSQEKTESEVEENVEEVLSPMVGVFYRAPAPDAEPFIEVGDEIKKGEVLCIIEAMKVMNEIKSELSGKIEEILVENGNQVEYNQPLFLIKK